MDRTVHSLFAIQNLLETGLLLTALLITIDRSIKRIITIYQAQSLLLMIVTFLSVVSLFRAGPLPGWNMTIMLVLVLLLPLLLALLIRPLLARATILTPSMLVLLGWRLRQLRSLLPPPLRSSVVQAEQLQRDAEQEWLHTHDPFNVRGSYLLVFVVMVLTAFLIASKIEVELAGQIGLLASLVLALSGLYNMVIKRDIISQVIGLLMMDHGLYLAVVKIVPIPFPATFFVVGLYFYTLITMFILVILLPRVRDVAASIELETVQSESQLRG